MLPDTVRMEVEIDLERTLGISTDDFLQALQFTQRDASGSGFGTPEKNVTPVDSCGLYEGRKCVGVFQKIMITLDLFLGVQTTML